MDVEARYLFGGVPAGSPVELTCRLEPAAFAPKQNADFTYGVWREAGKEPGRRCRWAQVEGELDADGPGAARLPAVPSAGSYRGPARIVARAAVFEAGSGRSTVGEAERAGAPGALLRGPESSTKKVRAGTSLHGAGRGGGLGGQAWSPTRERRPRAGAARGGVRLLLRREPGEER